MERSDIQALRLEWESAVAAHGSVFREGRMRGLTWKEIENLASAYVLRIDLAYARLKEAEAMQQAANAGTPIDPASVTARSAV